MRKLKIFVISLFLMSGMTQPARAKEIVKEREGKDVRKKEDVDKKEDVRREENETPDKEVTEPEQKENDESETAQGSNTEKGNEIEGPEKKDTPNEVKHEDEIEKEEEKEDDEDEDDFLDQSDAELLAELESHVEEEPRKGRKGRSGTTGRMQRFIQSMNPNISVIGTFMGAYTYDSKLKGDGHMMARDLEMKNGVHLQEVEVAFQAAVDPYFRMDIFLAFNETEAGVEEAYFTSLSLPFQLQVRAGVMNLRFGRQNQIHLHNFNFADNMLPVLRFLGNNMRAMAGELSWLIPIPWYASLSVSVSNPDGENTQSFVGDGERGEDFHVKDHRHLLYNTRLDQFFPMGANVGLNVGVSYALGPNNVMGADKLLTHLVGADMYLKWRPLNKPYFSLGLTAEGFYRRIETLGGELQDWGGYVELLWRVEKRWWLGFRYGSVEIEDAKELIDLGFEELPDNEGHPIAIDDQHRGTAAVTFRPTEYSQIRLQYNYNHVRQSLDDGSRGGWKPVHEVLLQLMGNLGTHGAHPY